MLEAFEPVFIYFPPLCKDRKLSYHVYPKSRRGASRIHPEKPAVTLQYCMRTWIVFQMPLRQIDFENTSLVTWGFRF